MQASQIQLVRTSFAAVQLTVANPAALFYDNLFAADPSLRKLFHGDMTQQGERLIAMIASALALLDRPTALMPVLRQLGRRHASYGVKPAHYACVGAALLKTLEQGLGEAFAPDVHEAWAALYAVISTTMIESASEGLLA